MCALNGCEACLHTTTPKLLNFFTNSMHCFNEENISMDVLRNTYFHCCCWSYISIYIVNSYLHTEFPIIHDWPTVLTRTDLAFYLAAVYHNDYDGWIFDWVAKYLGEILFLFCLVYIHMGFLMRNILGKILSLNWTFYFYWKWSP